MIRTSENLISAAMESESNLYESDDAAEYWVDGSSGGDSYDSFVEPVIPVEFIRPKWMHDVDNDTERVKRKARAEQIVEAIQGWKMPEIMKSHPRRGMKRESSNIGDVAADVVLRSVMNRGQRGGSQKVVMSSKSMAKAAPKHHLDLNKIPIPLAAAKGMSVQEMVQKMADQGKLVLENGKLVFRQSPMMNELKVSVKMETEEEDEEDDILSPVIMKVESVKSSSSEEKKAVDKSLDGEVTYFLGNEDDSRSEEEEDEQKRNTASSSVSVPKKEPIPPPPPPAPVVEEPSFKRPRIMPKRSATTLSLLKRPEDKIVVKPPPTTRRQSRVGTNSCCFAIAYAFRYSLLESF